MNLDFTRQETLALTTLDRNNLSYLEHNGMVVPQKAGGTKRPQVFYSAEQLFCLKVIERMTATISLQKFKLVIEFLKRRDYSPSLLTCELASIGGNVYPTSDWEALGKAVLDLAEHGPIYVAKLGTIGDFRGELAQLARDNHVPDYEQRIKGTPLELQGKASL